MLLSELIKWLCYEDESLRVNFEYQNICRSSLNWLHLATVI